MYFMTFKMKSDIIHSFLPFYGLKFLCLEVFLSFQEKLQTILMETDYYSTLMGICIAGAVNDISVLQSPNKVLRSAFSRS